MGNYAATERIGLGVTIDPTAQFINVQNLVIGDHTHIGPGVRIIGGDFEVGDYSKIHNDCYIYPKNRIKLGHCAWIGQGTHLDGTGGIDAGDFLGVGINSALYSHIRHGDITEGCRFDKNGSLRIGHDVWFVGMCLVSPVTVGDKSMALLGSVITRDMGANHIYGGNPAKDLTDKLGPPWQEVGVDEKAARLKAQIAAYRAEVDPAYPLDRIMVCDAFPAQGDDRTWYNVASREYTKTNAPLEVAFNKWLFGFRAKFRPRVA